MPDVKMNYGTMDEMAKVFGQAHSQMDDTNTAMENIAKTLEEGALLGTAGDAFRDAIRGKLVKRIKVISDKMSEMEKDIKSAVTATREGVSTAQGRFNN